MAAGSSAIFDSQVHIWGRETPERPWGGDFAGPAHGATEVTAEEILVEMDQAGVQGALLVPPSFEGDRNDLAMAAATQWPDRFRVLGRFPFNDPRSGDDIRRSIESGAMLGIRITFNAGASTWLFDGSLEWLWRFAVEHQVPVSLFPANTAQIAKLGEIAASYPDLKLSIDHMALGVDPQYFDSLAALDRLAPLAEHPCVTVKVSALPIAFPRTYSADVVHAVVQKLLGWFGPDRLFWGSDLTRAKPPFDDYATTVRAFVKGMAAFPESVRAKVMGQALVEWFGWS